MEKVQKTMAPSARRHLNETGVRRIPGRSILRIATWNVRSLLNPEKLINVRKEMIRLNIDICGLSDVRWKGSGKHQIDKDYVLYYSGSEESSNKHGVGIICTQSISTSATFVPVSNRAMMIQIQAKPRNMNIIQAYAPTQNADDEAVEELYSEVDQLLKITKKHEINFVMGDFNAKVGEGQVQGVVGKYGLGERNVRGDTFVQFCQEKELVVTNTFFQLPPRRLYTWTSPSHTPTHIVRNQIDFITINSRFKNCIKGVKTYPGADINSDHNPVVADLSCTLKKIRKKQNTRFDIRVLNDEKVKPKVANEINGWALDRIGNAPETVDDMWADLRSKVSEISNAHLRPKSWVNKQVWMTDKIYNLMEERRLHKNTPGKYKIINKEIRREVRFALNSWYKNRCEHVENLYAKHDAFNLHKEIKAMVGQKTLSHHQLVDENQVPILDMGKKMNLWEQYIEDLFSDDSREAVDLDLNVDDSRMFMKSEITKMLRRAKSGKAVGPDNVHIEILKLIDEEHIAILVDLFNLVYNTGHIPHDWLKSTFITLPKKNNAKKCEEFRTISLMSQVLKLFLSIIHERIRLKCDEQLSDSQFGFRSGVGTREALFAVQVLVQKCRDMQQNVFLCFIDYEKAFDKVQHNRLLALLDGIGLDKKDIRIIRNLYWNQRATVRIEGSESKEVYIRRGVRQGCILSPTLFNIYSEAIMTEALEDLNCGVKVNGRLINNLRYADDTILIASTEAELQEIVDRVNESSVRAGLKMNVTKTKFMIISNNTNIQPSIFVEGQRLEQVNKYKYLGTWLTQNWDSETEIKTRIEIARSAFVKMKKVLCNKKLKIKLRVRLIHCYIWPILLYGCEAWTIKEDMSKRIEAFEMWTYRRMMAISWTQKVTNEEVLRRVGQTRKLLQTVKQRKVAYLGHVLRHDRYQLLQLIMMGKVAGRRRVGRRKKSWLRNIREWTGIKSAAELFRLAKDKLQYAELTANLH